MGPVESLLRLERLEYLEHHGVVCAIVHLGMYFAC